ncbi:hypothetical protein SELMODRAFT_421650 [Selaginella moellendorffii]|uniref:Uncharacterized protein n=1 Tax=Selaginella moellendorffii TaxID=88036 RepID=D8SFX8_SELML|nr:hypothetical protein SELMODRAFT_421650 [Selaginella moellendorffii]
MARTEQERSGCVTGLWSLFRPKKAHKGDNKVHPEAMDAAALKLKVQDRVCEAVSGEAMDAAALKLKELRREVKIVLEAIRQERGHKEPIKPIKPEQEKEDEEENQEKKAEQLKEEKKAEQVNEEEKEADQMKPMKLEQEEENEAEKQLKEEEQEKKAEQLSEEEQEKEAHETKELRRELYEELNGKSSDRERIKRARKMMRLQKMLDRIPSERKPWKKLQSGEVVFVKEAKELYDRAGRDFVAEFKRRQRAEVNDECLFCQNHDGEKMIGRAGANSKTTRPWVYLRREHEQTVLSTSKKREMKLAPSSRSWLQGLAEKSITLQASKQASNQPPHSSKSREDQWIKFDYTLQCLEQGGIYLISFPVDGDETGDTAAECSYSCLDESISKELSVRLLQGKSNPKVGAGKLGAVAKYPSKSSTTVAVSEDGGRDGESKAAVDEAPGGAVGWKCSRVHQTSASKQARDPPPHSSKSREDQWIKFGYTLQCLEQGGIYLIGFPVDGDDSGAPAAVRLSMIVARNDVDQCQMAARWREDDIAEAARDWGFGWLRRL